MKAKYYVLMLMAVLMSMSVMGAITNYFSFDTNFNDSTNAVRCDPVSGASIQAAANCFNNSCATFETTSSQYAACDSATDPYNIGDGAAFSVRCYAEYSTAGYNGLLGSYTSSQSGGFSLGIDANGDFYIYDHGGGGIYNSYNYPDTDIAVDEGFVFHLVYDPFEGGANYHRLFKNGVELVNETTSQATDTEIAPFPPDTMEFGTVLNQYMDGVIDECQIWDEPLSPAAVLQDYNDMNPVCTENWVAYNTTCSVADQKTLYYLDSNDCGTYLNLPVNNGTVSSCNYCTLSSSAHTSCINGHTTTYYTNDNYGACCALTAIPADCNLPANVTGATCLAAYTPTHTSTDIPGVIIDFGVEYGLVLIGFVALIAVGGVVLFARKNLR